MTTATLLCDDIPVTSVEVPDNMSPETVEDILRRLKDSGTFSRNMRIQLDETAEAP